MIVGTAEFEVVPNSSGFASQLKNQVEQPVQNTARTIGTALAGAFATREIFRFGTAAVSAFREAEAAGLRLTATFEEQPKLIGANVAAFERLAEAKAKITAFDDDAIKAGVAQLAQFKLTGEQLKVLTPLMVDYAARIGQDVPSAAASLGKALLGQGRALKTIGIDFEDAGSRAKNFDQLVAGLRDQVGGFAEREGKSAGGQAAIMANQFGELQEALGQTISMGLSPMIGVLTDVTGALMAAPAPIQTLVTGSLSLIGTLGLAGIALKTFQSTLANVGIQANLTGAALTKGLGIAGIITGGVVILGNALEDVTDEMFGWKSVAEQTAIEQERLAKAVRLGTVSLGDAATELRVYNELMSMIPGGVKLSADAIGINAKAIEMGTGVMDGFAGATRGVNEALDEQAQQARETRDAMLGLSGGLVSVLQASDDVKEAEAALKDLREKGKRGTQEYREALFEVINAHDREKAEIKLLTQSLRDNGLGFDDIRTRMEKVVGQTSLTKDEINRLIREGLDKLPASANNIDPINTKLDRTKANAEAAKDAIKGILDALSDIPGSIGGAFGPGTGRSSGRGPDGGGSSNNPPVVLGPPAPRPIVINMDGRALETGTERRRLKTGGL